MVTTSAIAPWDISQCLRLSSGGVETTPGGEFAGNIVEIGSGVRRFEINDLVFALSGCRDESGNERVFGLGSLDGGHADYVLVPGADLALVKTTPGAEERTLLAGGTLALGASAAEVAQTLATSGEGVVTASGKLRLIVAGCDPLGTAAIACLRRTNTFSEIVALDSHPARLALAKRYGARPVNVRQPGAAAAVGPADIVVVGALDERPSTAWIAGAVRAGGRLIFTEPGGIEKWRALDVPLRDGVKLAAAGWPSQDAAQRFALDVQLRRLDITAMVSHVVPLDMAADAYGQACERAPGVQKVLLKP